MLRLPRLDREGSIQAIPPRQQPTTHAENPCLSLGSDTSAVPVSSVLLPDQNQSDSTIADQVGTSDQEPANITIPTPSARAMRSRPPTRLNGSPAGNWDSDHTFRSNRL